MSVWYSIFFWFSQISYPTLIRDGKEAILPGEHTRANVVTEMFRQICFHYNSLPDPSLLTLDDIEFFYDGIRGMLKEQTKASNG